jgi:hypothetical protein
LLVVAVAVEALVALVVVRVVIARQLLVKILVGRQVQNRNS